MNSRTTQRFRKLYRNLPIEIRKKVRETYQLWRENPAHPSLQFKRVSKAFPIYSARIDLDYRAVGLRKDDGVTWDWVGNHTDYDRLLKHGGR